MKRYSFLIIFTFIFIVIGSTCVFASLTTYDIANDADLEIHYIDKNTYDRSYLLDSPMIGKYVLITTYNTYSFRVHYSDSPISYGGNFAIKSDSDIYSRADGATSYTNIGKDTNITIGNISINTTVGDYNIVGCNYVVTNLLGDEVHDPTFLTLSSPYQVIQKATWNVFNSWTGDYYDIYFADNVDATSANLKIYAESVSGYEYVGQYSLDPAITNPFRFDNTSPYWQGYTSYKFEVIFQYTDGSETSDPIPETTIISENSENIKPTFWVKWTGDNENAHDGAGYYIKTSLEGDYKVVFNQMLIKNQVSNPSTNSILHLTDEYLLFDTHLMPVDGLVYYELIVMSVDATTIYYHQYIDALQMSTSWVGGIEPDAVVISGDIDDESLTYEEVEGRSGTYNPTPDLDLDFVSSAVEEVGQVYYELQDSFNLIGSIANGLVPLPIMRMFTALASLTLVFFVVKIIRG